MTTIRQIQSPEQINDHVALVYHIQPPMSVNVDGTAIPVDRFIHTPERPAEIVLKTRSSHLPQERHAELKYRMDGFEHYFRCQIVNFKILDGMGSFLKIALPKAIRAINRRNFLRISPDEQAPVMVTLHLPDKGPICCPVQDISMGGFSTVLPPGDDHSSYPSEMKVELQLSEPETLPATIICRHRIQRPDGIRMGAEFNQISSEIQTKIVDYIVEQTLRRSAIYRPDHAEILPLLCIIHDNQKIDTALRYLEPSYRLVHQNIRAAWDSMARMTPDALLFNLDSIRPDHLLTQIRSLTNLQKTPAIVITDDQEADMSCEATFLSQFKDPAALIEAVTLSIRGNLASPGSLRSGPPAAATRRSTETAPAVPATDRTILVVDLKQNVSTDLINTIKSENIRVIILDALQGIFDHIKQIDPKLILINSDWDATISNFIRMKGINRFTRTLPLSILVGQKIVPPNALRQQNTPSVLTIPDHLPPQEIARLLIKAISK